MAGNRRGSRGSRRNRRPSNEQAGPIVQGHGGSYGGGGTGYDAVSPSTMRGAIIWPELDTRKEITPHTRVEMMRKARALTENVGFAAHLLEGAADLIGYLYPMAATADDEWNDLANSAFEAQEIPEVFDASGKFGFYEYQLQANIAAFRDGDVLPVLTETATGAARLATYEAHQIVQPFGRIDGKWMDGVRVNRFNRHEAYNLTDPDDRSVNRTILANNSIYYAHFKKIGHVRSVSVFRAAINDLQDMGEINRDIKYGIKVRNQIPLTMEKALGTPSYGASVTDAVVGQVKKAYKPGIDGQGNATLEKYNYEEVMHGGNIPQLPPGVSLKALIDSAPHPNQLGMLDRLARSSSLSLGLPLEIMWDLNSLRGASNRLLNSKLQRWIGQRMLRQEMLVRRYWVYATAKEMKAGRLRAPRDPVWWKPAMLPQASLTADRGREGKLDIELVRERLLSLRNFFAKEGQHWLAELKQIAREKKELNDLGLTIDDITKGKGRKDDEEEEEEIDDEEEDDGEEERPKKRAK